MWGHIERATVRMQMCRGPGCPVRVRTGAGWIVRDGAAGRATCGSTADHLALWSRRPGYPDVVVALTADGVLERTGDATSTTVRVMMEMSAARETEADEGGHFQRTTPADLRHESPA